MLTRMQTKRISFALMRGMQVGAATLEYHMEVPQKNKNRTTLQPSNCTSRCLSKGCRYAVSKGHMHPNVYSSTINNGQSVETAQMSLNRWIKKMWCIYTYGVCVHIYIYVYIQTGITQQSKRMKSCHLLLCR